MEPSGGLLEDLSVVFSHNQWYVIDASTSSNASLRCNLLRHQSRCEGCHSTYSCLFDITVAGFPLSAR